VSGSKNDCKGTNLFDLDCTTNSIDFDPSNTKASEANTDEIDLEIQHANEIALKSKNGSKLMEKEMIENLKSQVRKFRANNSSLEDEKIELFEKIASEKQKYESLEEKTAKEIDNFKEIISQKEKDVQLACRENTKVVCDNRRLHEILKFREKEIYSMKSNTCGTTLLKKDLSD